MTDKKLAFTPTDLGLAALVQVLFEKDVITDGDVTKIVTIMNTKVPLLDSSKVQGVYDAL
jgi:hypothetical protein